MISWPTRTFEQSFAQWIIDSQTSPMNTSAVHLRNWQEAKLPSPDTKAGAITRPRQLSIPELSSFNNIEDWVLLTSPYHIPQKSLKNKPLFIALLQRDDYSEFFQPLAPRPSTMGPERTTSLRPSGRNSSIRALIFCGVPVASRE